MKRTIALLAGFMCIMSFTACGDSNSSEELSENSVTEITEPQTTSEISENKSELPENS